MKSKNRCSTIRTSFFAIPLRIATGQNEAQNYTVAAFAFVFASLRWISFWFGAPGLVSRRPVRGEGVQAAGFYTVAVSTPQAYPTKPIRLIVPFAEGGTPGLVSRRPVRGEGVQAAGF